MPQQVEMINGRIQGEGISWRPANAQLAVVVEAARVKIKIKVRR
jgi:hypothetical protein